MRELPFYSMWLGPPARPRDGLAGADHGQAARSAGARWMHALVRRLRRR